MNRPTAFLGNLQKLFKQKDHTRHQDVVSAAAEGYLAWMMYGCYPGSGPFGFEIWWSGAQDTSLQPRAGWAWDDLCSHKAVPLCCFGSLSQIKSQGSFSVLLSLVGLSPGWFNYWKPQGDRDSSYSGSLSHYNNIIDATSFMPPLRSTFTSVISFVLPMNWLGKLVKQY